MKKTLAVIILSIISTGAMATSGKLIEEQSMIKASEAMEGLTQDSVFQAKEIAENTHYIRGMDSRALIILPDNNFIFFGNYLGANFISPENPQVNPLSLVNKEGNAKIFESLNNNTITVKSSNETQEIMVLVDPKCGYCLKLHSEEQSYLNQGFTLKYVPFPVLDNPKHGVHTSRQGLEYAYSASSNEDKLSRLNEVIDYLKANRDQKNLPERFLSKITESGTKAVQDARNKFEPLGVTGTPAILDSKGAFVGGYVPAAYLNQELMK